MTQEELGKIFGVDRATISRYETGSRDPDPELVRKFADFFGVSTDYLLGRTDDPHGTFAPSDDPNAAAVAKIAAALQADPELLEFWQELSRRQDLQLMFKQVKDFSPETIRRVVRIIKAIEDEEAE
jgi:transcriptional regulator with XRE-family HTH domain